MESRSKPPQINKRDMSNIFHSLLANKSFFCKFARVFRQKEYTVNGINGWKMIFFFQYVLLLRIYLDREGLSRSSRYFKGVANLKKNKKNHLTAIYALDCTWPIFMINTKES